MAASASAGRRIITNTSALSAASLWRIGVAFVLQVLVGRRLGAEGLGIYALGMALLNVAQVVVEAGLPALLVRDLAGSLPAQRRDAYGQARAIMLALAILLAAGAGIVAFAVGDVGSGGRLALLALLFLSLPFYALMASALTIFEASERFDLVLAVDGATNATLLVATALVLLTGGALSAIFAVLVAVQALAALLAVLLLRRVSFQHGQVPASPLAWPKSIALMRRALPTFGLALTDVVQQRLDLLLVAAFTTPAITGLYAAAVSLVRVLLKLAQAWWRSLYPTLSRLRDQAPAQGQRLAALATRLGVSGTSLAAVVLTTAALPLMTLIYGADYAQAAPLLRVLAWSAPLYLLLLRAVILLLVERRPRASLAVALSQVLALAVLLPAALLWGGAQAATVAVVASGAPGILLGVLLTGRDPLRAPQESDASPTLSRWPLIGVAGAALCAVVAGSLSVGWAWQTLAALSASLLLLWLARCLKTTDLMRLRHALRPPV